MNCLPAATSASAGNTRRRIIMKRFVPRGDGPSSSAPRGAGGGRSGQPTAPLRPRFRNPGWGGLLPALPPPPPVPGGGGVGGGGVGVFAGPRPPHPCPSPPYSGEDEEDLVCP